MWRYLRSTGNSDLWFVFSSKIIPFFLLSYTYKSEDKTKTINFLMITRIPVIGMIGSQEYGSNPSWISSVKALILLSVWWWVARDIKRNLNLKKETTKKAPKITYP